MFMLTVPPMGGFVGVPLVISVCTDACVVPPTAWQWIQISNYTGKKYFHSSN